MGKKIVFGMALMCVLFGSLYAKEQNFVKEGKQPSDFVGKKAKLITANYGDLNGDNRKDMVFDNRRDKSQKYQKGRGV